MTITPIVSTLGNAALALSYYFISPKIKALTHVGLKTQMQAFGVSALVQSCFQYIDEDPDKKSTLTENVIRYSLPFILIGGASVYADKAAFKTNALVTTLLGVSQLAIGHVTANAVDERINSKPFDADSWEKHYGKVEEVPKPDNIEEILNAPCPFWPGKKVRDTHMLTLIPATVDGKPFTLDLLSQLIQNPKAGYKNKISLKVKTENCLNQEPIKDAYWVLMTKNIVSKKRSYIDQKKQIQDVGLDYRIPTVLEATTSILTHYVRRGERLYKINNELGDDFFGVLLGPVLGGPIEEKYTKCQSMSEGQTTDFLVGGLSSSYIEVEESGFPEDLPETSIKEVQLTLGISAIRRL